MNIASFVYDVARRQPGNPGVTCGSTTRSYGEFADRFTRLAGALRAQGLAPGDRVLLFMDNCGEYLEVLMACWTAGLCTVPVNAKLHYREVEHIASNSGAKTVFTTPYLQATAEKLPGALEGLSVICAGTDQYERLLTAGPLRPMELDATHRAWIFYTSGTTGKPKGAVLTHRNLLCTSLTYYADIDQISPADTKFHAAPLSHGSGLYAVPHLMRGAHQVVFPGFDLDAIAEALTRYDNVTMFAVPTTMTRMMRHQEKSPLPVERIRTIYYGGAPMYVADLEKALAVFGPRLFHLYGQGESPMTITGLGKTMHIDDGSQRFRDRLGSCGYARTGMTVKVVDGEGRELPPGEVGEVVCRGDCVMEGYWNNPTANAETLKGGWLHTGDLGSMDETGLLTLNDRSKDLIISGGTNIYPREVEEALLYHPSVAEVSVVGRPHPDWGEEAVAFVVVKEGAQPVSAEELDALCLDRIARFKRPKAYRFLDALPKSGYGKILKTELRKLLSEGESK